MNKELLEKARREWKEHATLIKTKRLEESKTETPNVPSELDDNSNDNNVANPLTISSATKHIEQNKDPGFEEEITKTIAVKNLPLDDNVEGKLRQIFHVPAGISTMRFYPKGDTRTALIQFNEFTGLSGQYISKYAKIGTNFIDIEPAKICIRQFEALKMKHSDEALKRKHEQLVSSKSSQTADVQVELQQLKAENAALRSQVARYEEILRNHGLLPLKPSHTQTQTQTQTQTTAKQLSEEEMSLVLISQRLQKEKKQASTDVPTLLCTICFLDCPMDQIYTLDSCSHKYCTSCLADWITSKVTEGEVNTIVCPDTHCHIEISYSEIHQIVNDKGILDKYEKFTLQKALERIPDMRWCPRPGCGNAMKGGADTLLMRCSNLNCKFCFCFNCKEQWHADATCAQYQAWKRDAGADGEKNVQAWMRQHTKQCPACKAHIEKNGGCNHMTCAKCKHEFCWICSAQYTSNHFNGYSGAACPQYS